MTGEKEDAHVTQVEADQSVDDVCLDPAGREGHPLLPLVSDELAPDQVEEDCEHACPHRALVQESEAVQCREHPHGGVVEQREWQDLKELAQHHQHCVGRCSFCEAHAYESKNDRDTIQSVEYI